MPGSQYIIFCGVEPIQKVTCCTKATNIIYAIQNDMVSCKSKPFFYLIYLYIYWNLMNKKCLEKLYFSI